MLKVSVVLLLLTLLSTTAQAERRVALVIGNGAYAKVGVLPNPTRDATAMEDLFRKAGFDFVEVKRDLGLATMRKALRDFSDQVRDADIAVVSFAGHGIEVNGTNYLIPVDAALERDIDVEDETVSVDRVTQILDQAKRLRLVILDACRDNPFVRSMRRTVASRSIGRGLAEVRVLTADTLIAFAAKAGSTAADGEGANSPYTIALVKHLTTPGLDVRLALGRVRDEVVKSTATRQEPFVYGSLGGAEISLVAKAPDASTPPVTIQTTEAERAWDRIKDTKNIAALDLFIASYKETYYAGLARLRIDELKRQQVAVASPPPRPAPSSPQSYPDRPITMVVPVAPGGPSDFVARYLSSSIEKDLGQPVQVQNIPGGGGAVAAAKFEGTAGDGYTLLFWASSASALLTMRSTPVATVAVQGNTVYGVVAPVGTPDSVVQRLNAAINNALAKSTDLKSALVKIGAEPKASTPRDAAVLIRSLR